MKMLRTNPQLEDSYRNMDFIACSKANAEKQAKNYSPIYGGMYYTGEIVSISEPLVEGVDFRIEYTGEETSRPYKVGKKLYAPDMNFIKEQMSNSDEKIAAQYFKIYH